MKRFYLVLLAGRQARVGDALRTALTRLDHQVFILSESIKILWREHQNFVAFAADKGNNGFVFQIYRWTAKCEMGYGSLRGRLTCWQTTRGHSTTEHRASPLWQTHLEHWLGRHSSPSLYSEPSQEQDSDTGKRDHEKWNLVVWSIMSRATRKCQARKRHRKSIKHFASMMGSLCPFPGYFELLSNRTSVEFRRHAYHE